MSGRRLRVGLTQWCATQSVEENTSTALALISQAGADGAELILLPENGLCLGTNAEMRQAALAIDSPAIGALRDAAATAAASVVMGGFKRLDGNGEIFNTALVIGSDGELAGGYDKIHLFNARVGGRTFNASGVEHAGGHPALAEFHGVRLGMTICFDVRFPELARRLAVEGAEVLLVPSAFTQATGEAHWETLLRARAIENAIYVVASATISGSDSSFPTYGHALIVDPWGRVLVDLERRERAFAVVELDLDERERIRDRLSVHSAIRADAYAADLQLIQVS